MGSALVVKCKGPLQTLVEQDGIIADLQIDVLALDTPPRPLHKYVANSPAFKVHPNPDTSELQLRCKLRTDELIGIEDFRLLTL